MKIIWNNPSPSKNSPSKISLPKPKGEWIANPETDFSEVADNADNPGKNTEPVVHIPEATKLALSIQEINLYEQEIVEETEIVMADVTEVVQNQSAHNKTQETNSVSTQIQEQSTSFDSEPTVIVDLPPQETQQDEETAAEQTIVLPSSLVEIETTAALEHTQSVSANDARFRTHQSELRQMAVFCLSIFTMALVPYTSPALADYRPWTSNEAPPLIGLWTQQQKMTEDASGALVAVDVSALDDSTLSAGTSLKSGLENASTFEDLVENPTPTEADLLEEAVQEEEALSAINEIAIVVPKEDHLEPLEPRSPAQPERLHVPKGSLDKYFSKLSLIEDGTDQVARALVWGDSTIASDGIIKDVRSRMQDRFGDSGPGFLAAKVDRRWAFRRDIVRNTEGSWSAKNIVHGGANDSRYGLAGTVSIAHPGARSILGGVEINDERQDLHRFQVFYQRAPEGGDLTLSTQSKSRSISTKSDNVSDGYYELIVPDGDPYVYLEAQNKDVVIYGVALEVDAPGVTWETFGVAGSSISSMQKQHDAHLSNQIAARDPSLLVYWTGGNELGYPSLKSSTGKSYKKYYRKVVRNLKDGAPQASCLLIGPLDQATRENGQIVSKPTLDKLIRFQREVAEEEGCAYWDARAAMGGNNAFKEWLSHTPALASPDLAHLTGRGRKRIGDTLADVLLREYDLWRIDNPEVFWTPEESVADPTGDLWHFECDNPEPSAYELMLNALNNEDVCAL